MQRGRRGVSVPPPARAPPVGGGASLWTESLSAVLAAQLGDVPQAAAIVETIAAALAPTLATETVVGVLGGRRRSAGDVDEKIACGARRRVARAKA